MEKYIEKPQATKISMKKSANLSFPDVTICGSFGKDEEGKEMGLNKSGTGWSEEQPTQDDL